MSRAARRGLTLVEIVVAAIMGALIAGGTMMAFVMAAGMAKSDGADTVEAVFYTEQTLERFRNHIACDDAWFDPVQCTSAGVGWTADALPAQEPGAESPLLASNATRDYEVVPWDCDGNGTPGDCYRVTARVQWSGTQ
jgi:hypothetical protein